MVKKLSLNDCQNIAKDHGGKCLSAEYKNNYTKLKWQCKYGHQWETVAKITKRGFWCPICAGVKVYSIDDCRKSAQNMDGYCLSTEYKSVKSKYKWQCKQGHQWEAAYEPIRRGHWCPVCSNVAKKTIEDCHSVAQKKEGKCLSTEYKNNNTKMLWECKQGHQWEALFSSINKGSWCRVCSGSLKLTIDHCQEFAKNKSGKCLSTRYINNKSKLKWECDKGHRWYATFKDVKDKNSWCLKCAGLVKKTIEDCNKVAQSKGGKCLSDKYANVHAKLKWQCKKGHIWSSSFSHIKNKTWCPECAGLKKKSINDCVRLADKRGGKCLSKKYINSKAKLKWQCEKNHIWKVSYNCVSNGVWCPQCSIFKSQNKLIDIVTKLFSNHTVKSNFREFDWLRYKNNMEIDIWIPEIKLAIEYDGEQHFFPVDFGGMNKISAIDNFNLTKKRDQLKNKLISEHSEEIHTFIRIPYTELLEPGNIRDIINRNTNNNRRAHEKKNNIGGMSKDS